MHKKILQLAILGLLPFLTGCIDTKDQYTINPDGSGKVVHESILTTFYVNSQTTDKYGHVMRESRLTSVVDKQPSGDDLKGAVKNILENTKGVDAWRDLSYKIQDDGKIYFKGTAYFPDIRQLKIDNQGTSTNLGDIQFQSDLEHISLELNNQPDNKTGSLSAPILPQPQTEDEMKKAVARQTVQYQQMMRPMMASFLTSLKVEKTFILPGTIEAITNFQKKEDGSVNIQWDGSKILGMMDQLANDPDFITKRIKEGKNIVDQNGFNSNEFNKMLFGQDAPIRVDLSGPFKPLFDYQGEMQEAKMEYTKILSDLNIVSTPVAVLIPPVVLPVAPPVVDNTAGSKVSIILKNGTTVEGKVIEKAKNYVKLDFKGTTVTFYNDEIEKIAAISTDINPASPDFNMMAGTANEGNFKVDHINANRGGASKYFKLYISGILKKPVLSLSKGTVTVAQTDSGESLLSDRSRDQKIHFPRVTADGLQVLFNFKLKQPSSNAAVIKDISGVLEYNVASGTQKVDLGIDNFTDAAQGKEYQAVIENIKTEQDKAIISVHLNLNFDQIRTLEFYDEQGQKIPVSRWGYSKQGNSATLKYALKDSPFPSHGKIIAEIYEGFQTYQMPFELKDVRMENFISSPLPHRK